MNGHCFIGTSGFAYNHWQGVLYPEKLPQKQWLEFYANRFDTVEINSSFYHMPRAVTCANWRTRVPEHFRFAIKASRVITHYKMLHNIEEPLRTLYDVIRPLEKKLGPVLFQLPPGMKRDLSMLARFLDKIPTGHRTVFEFRNKDWYGDDLLNLLDGAGCAFCIHDLPGSASPVAVTGGFAYIRFHGAQQAYASSYSGEELEQWAERIQNYMCKGNDVFVYFNNDAYGYAVGNAMTLKTIVMKNSNE